MLHSHYLPTFRNYVNILFFKIGNPRAVLVLLCLNFQIIYFLDNEVAAL